MILKADSIKKLCRQERRAEAKDLVKGKHEVRGWSRKKALSAGSQFVERWESGFYTGRRATYKSRKTGTLN